MADTQWNIEHLLATAVAYMRDVGMPNEADAIIELQRRAATPPADAALSSVVIPAGCVCTTKANDMAALIESAICDAELERIIEESDARWTEDMFHVHGGELMDMLRKAAAIRDALAAILAKIDASKGEVPLPLSALVCVGRARFPRTGGNAGISWHVEDALSDTGGFRSGNPCNGELLFVLPATAKRAMLAASQQAAKGEGA